MSLSLLVRFTILVGATLACRFVNSVGEARSATTIQVKSSPTDYSNSDAEDQVFNIKWAEPGRRGYIMFSANGISGFDGCALSINMLGSVGNGIIDLKADNSTVMGSSCEMKELEEPLSVDMIPNDSWIFYRLEGDQLVVIDGEGRSFRYEKLLNH